MAHRSGHTHQKLQIWYCDECRSVHLRTDNVCLSFTRSEFAELSEAVMDIYHAEIAPVIEKEIDLAEIDSVLESDLIA